MCSQWRNVAAHYNHPSMLLTATIPVYHSPQPSQYPTNHNHPSIPLTTTIPVCHSPQPSEYPTNHNHPSMPLTTHHNHPREPTTDAVLPKDGVASHICTASVLAASSTEYQGPRDSKKDSKKDSKRYSKEYSLDLRQYCVCRR